MRSVKLHIKEEWDKERIRDTDYSNVYLGALKEVLGLSVQYAHVKSKLALELQLLEAQINHTAAETVLVTKQGGLVDSQSNKEDIETAKLQYEIQNRLPLEVLHLQAETRSTDAKTRGIEADTLLSAQQLELAKVEQLIKGQQVELAKVEKQLKTQMLELQEREMDLKEAQLPIIQADVALKQAQLPLLEKDVLIKDQQVKLRG